MKRFALTKLVGLVLAFTLASTGHTVEILHWARLPLAVHLVVGQERVVFIDRNVRVGVPASVGDRLRVQSAGGAIYLRASEPIAPTRVQLQDVASGALILLDLTAEPAEEGQAPLEPVRIVEDTSDARHVATHDDGGANPDRADASQDTPIPVVLIRYASQNLYAPLRTVEPVARIGRANLPQHLGVGSLLPASSLRVHVLAAWRLRDQWVTAVRLTNTGDRWLDLDPRALQGDFVAAAFQHPNLGPSGQSTDTTVLYLVTRGHGLAESLLPAISPIAPLPPVAAAGQAKGGRDAQ